MTTLELEVSVKGSRSKVFETLTDFENFQKQSPLFFPHLQVKSKRGNVCVIEQHLVLAKKEFVMMTKHIVNYPATHEYFVIGGDCKGSHVVEEFTLLSNDGDDGDSNNGKGNIDGTMTKVSIKGEIKIPRKMIFKKMISQEDLTQSYKDMIYALTSALT